MNDILEEILKELFMIMKKSQKLIKNSKNESIINVNFV